ncbi:HD family phosphohydrolase [Magnetofaba australis]|uniref:Putative metal dependent phosphohydrolase with GAF sensor n=1 Tax=Magnetofaba australis IT-1 TaxID=1434232 RepID=A0A1Y2K6W4_9PROT|nr:HD family phosphohydrolase [Magnetofaba australis]OSM04092.1 putative metal dependent phosphohydrolase with GAF sensor [Magnetofaba australis IT-1]
MSFDAFHEEEAVLATGQALLESGDASQLSGAFETLLKDYKKLFKTTKRLVKLSDRNEAQLMEAQARIESHSAELQKAHATLERHAELLEEKVAERTRDLVLSQKKLEKLVELGIALSMEKDPDRLLRSILMGGKEIAQADRATLYVRNEDDTLSFAYMSSNDALPAFKLPLYDEQGQPIHQYVATHVTLTGETVRLDDLYGDTGQFDVSGAKKFDAASGYRTTSMVTVALKAREGRVIGALQLINAINADTGAVEAFDPELVSFVEALGAQGAVALDNLNLIKIQEELFESIIQVLASAIDAKSPYTGGHCLRVPELGKMLAQAACDAKEGPFGAFDMDESDWRAFHLAGWLHDCGKVTTPEYVVDKATKLETIYNRMHEVRTRFEVLRRDAEIAYLQGMLDGKEDPAVLAERRDAAFAQLQDDFAFVAECNVGGEFMSPERVERLKQIAQITWQRYFDDRLGISHAESRRLVGESAPLPATEQLLCDKPEHVVDRSESPISYDPEALGLKIDIPENLYNYGELYNLCIGRGTLTNEERFKINEHIIYTMVMLGELHFPPELQNIAEMAGGHHETMIGTGYPKKLERAQMTLQARMLAIADIFEALTASDRPYKKPKTLSESLRIMSFMRNDQHIDAELFDLFLSQGIYTQYAERFLPPEQIDEVDISKFLSRQES